VLASDQSCETAHSADPGRHDRHRRYHWFGDWGRDTMIALPGLALRRAVRRSPTVLTTFARFVDAACWPNRFPDAGEAPEYHTVDATLWYFEPSGLSRGDGDDGFSKSCFRCSGDRAVPP